MAEKYPDIEVLRQEIRELRQRLDDAPVPSETVESGMPTVIIIKAPPKRQNL